ncbi:MAG: ribbon-helix-helix protein, CopG family [Alkalispirochaeta sp.]
MKHRTSFTLDEGTIERLKRLAHLWDVPQAEAVRRAIERAEKDAQIDARLVMERLAFYRRKNSLERRAAEDYLSEVASHRQEWERSR